MNKLFRVFFSSTFSDFVEERNALNKEVFPRLKELCAAHGARFQPIDLRWGIPDEAALQQSTMQICLEEIKRCQNLTPRPNFLVLLGDRYGWTPPPAKIPKTEYDIISAHFSEKGKAFIKEWYRLDENELCKLDDGTITTVYELQPRGENYEDYKVWEPVEKKLQMILLDAARKSNLSKKEMVKYFASATHQEIVLGALDTAEAATHVHCFFRKLNGLPKDVRPEIYIEPNSASREALLNLNKELKEKLPENLHEYEIDLGDEKEKEKYLEEFCDDVYNSLETTILRELDEMEDVSALDEEISAHLEFSKNRTKVFVGREDILKEIVNYVKIDYKAPLIIYGKPGSGKSALMAKALERLEKENIDAMYIIRFIGTTPSSSDSIGIIRSLCEQVISRYKIKRDEFDEEIPFEYNKLKETLLNILSLLKERKRVVLLLDALDQLSKSDKGRDFGWLPQELPENVKLITSLATDDIGIMNTLEKKFPDSLHKLKKLTPKEGGIVLDFLLESALRSVTHNQKKILLQKFSKNGLPLYIKLAFEEACTWNSFSDVNYMKLAPDIESLIQILFKRLYREHTRETVEKILSYIVSARNGLTEDEILDVLTSDLEYFTWYKTEQTHHELPEERLPWIVWSRLYSDLEPYLTTRGVDHTSTISFFHRQFDEAVKKNLLSEIAEDYHQVLANFFNIANVYYEKSGTKTPNYRKLSELVYNLRKGKMWKLLQNILTSLEFIEVKCTAQMTDDLFIDYNQALDGLHSKEMPDEFRNNIKEFKLFFFNQAHILRKYPHLTVQQALNQPDSTLPSLSGKTFIKPTVLLRPWIEWINKPQIRDPCILTLTGHSDKVFECAFSPDGTMVISASDDKTLKLWNVKTGAEINTFTGHSAPVQGCTFSQDGTIVASASRDKTLKLWNVETGSEINTFTGHSAAVSGCDISPEGTMLVSASDDKTLKLWNIETSTEIMTFKGHSSMVTKCAFSPNGKMVISASDDKTLKLWNVKTGAEIRKFTEHTGSVWGCAFSPDGTKMVSASDDETLKLWDVKTGSKIRIFSGHFAPVYGCAFSPDGMMIVSASWDAPLKLWNVKTGAEISSLTGHTHMVFGCVFSPDGKLVASASRDKTLKLWNVETGDGVNFFTKHSDRVFECAFSPDGTMVVSASGDKTLKLWNVKMGTEIRILRGHNGTVYGCAFSPDGTKVVSASLDNTLKLWDAEVGTEIRTFKGHSGIVKGCAFSPDGTIVVSASGDKTLKLWDAELGTEIRTLMGHSRSVEGCAFSPDGTKVVSASLDNTLKLWDAEVGTEIRTFKGHSGIVKGCAFSPNGTMVVSASSDHTLKLWEVETGAEIRIFTGHSASVMGCAFSPDGMIVASSSDNGMLKLWDINTGTELLTFPTLGGPYSIAIGPNGLIAAGDSAGWVYLLRAHGIDLT